MLTILAAVDNVLERFAAYNSTHNLLDEEKIIRAATESSRVNKALQKFTVDSRLGGSITDNPRLVQKAVKRVKEARIVFTTCSGAGLGVLRNVDFLGNVRVHIEFGAVISGHMDGGFEDHSKYFVVYVGDPVMVCCRYERLLYESEFGSESIRERRQRARGTFQ